MSRQSMRAPRLIRADSVLKTAEHGMERRCGDSNRITRLAEELTALCDEAGGYKDAFTPATLLELAQYRSPVPVRQTDATATSRGNTAMLQAAYAELVAARASSGGPRGRQVTVDPQAFSDMLIYMRNNEANSALREAVRNHAAFRGKGGRSRSRRSKARRSSAEADSESLLADQVAWLVKRARCNDELQSFLLAAKALVCRATLGSAGITGTVVESAHLGTELRKMAADTVVTQADTLKLAEAKDATFCADKFDLGVVEGVIGCKKEEGPPTCLRMNGNTRINIKDSNMLRFEQKFCAQFMLRVRHLSNEGATLLHASQDSGSTVRGCTCCAALRVRPVCACVTPTRRSI